MKYALNKKKPILGLRILETIEDSTHQFFPPKINWEVIFSKFSTFMLIPNCPMFIQVEYCPCVILNECWNMMKELLQSMVGNSAETPPPVLKHKPDTVYTPSDTILQYLDHFNNFRKAVSAPPPSRWTFVDLKGGWVISVKLTAYRTVSVTKSMCPHVHTFLKQV